ncbi:flavodoxin family protein [Methanococcoides alaskense]|uniref:Multimeric flavodoxin WrbA n=1 Tax=Methanococcoides alaskense TaxID=325778 RepID=A0AA90U221_9EURY|nr:flavodoxin family protein [Methanococcoides alaskense]MDA0525496.1 flavodoxin family protein [Methanococcoides alaskense]MDR6223873.1 multimeric flavodoxin WrbA [Methanococcoides alaskense]
MNKVKIIGIGGSPRKNGNTDILLDNFLKGAESAGAETKKVLLRNYSIESCIGCEACRKAGTCTQFHDGMELLYPEIEGSKGLILGSPTYNYNITSSMKSFIDRLYPYYNFTNDRPRQYSSKLGNQGRKAIVFSICEQSDIKEMGFALEAMEMPLEALGYEDIEKFPVTSCFDRGVVSKDTEVLKKAFEAGKKLAMDLR